MCQIDYLGGSGIITMSPHRPLQMSTGQEQWLRHLLSALQLELRKIECSGPLWIQVQWCPEQTRWSIALPSSEAPGQG